MLKFIKKIFSSIYGLFYYLLIIRPLNILKGIRDIFYILRGYVKCPNCQKWSEKKAPIKQNHLGKKIIQEWKTEVHYLSKGYNIPKSSDRIKHKYKVDKEVNYYSNTYKCSKCNQLFKLEEY